MSGKEQERPEMQQIELNRLNLQSLLQLKKQVDQDLSIFQNSLNALKMAQGRYLSSRTAVEKIEPTTKDSSIMVPLTASMFVHGQLSDTERVMVDVGTGYYIDMTRAKAEDYFKRKVTFITEQMEKIQVIGLEKSKIRDAIMDVMEEKMQAQYAAQKASGASA